MSRSRLGRRKFLSYGLVGVATAFAGCSSLEPPETTETNSPPSLNRVGVRNQDATERTVDVVIERDDAIAYWNSFDVRSKNRAENVVYGPDITPPSFEAGPAEWTVAARLDGQTTGTKLDLDTVSQSGGCFDVMIEIRDATVEFLHDTPDCSE